MNLPRYPGPDEAEAEGHIRTALGLVAFWFLAAIIPLRAVQVSYTTSVIVAGGLLGMWVSVIVRRALEGEVGRTTLARFLPRHVIEGAHHDPLALLTEPRSVDDLNRERSIAGQDAVRIGVGVHSGPIVAGCIGSGLRLEFTVLGDTVNIASRLEALTKEHGATLLVSDDTVRRAGAVDGAPALEPIGSLAIRGRSDGLPAHALRG